MATHPDLSVTAGHGLLPSSPSAPLPSLPLARRGRLRNGARPGDFLAAPRCGARTRSAGCCRQPAMTNGRCRLHGGLSTGPRTSEGRARCAAARTIHGGYNAETRALLAEARAAMRDFRALIAPLRPRPTAGHGVLSSKSKIHHRGHRVHRDSIPARAARPNPSSVSSVVSPSCSSKPAPTAGHGVLPQKPSLIQRALLGTTALGISIRPAAAGHGVLPRIRRAG